MTTLAGIGILLGTLGLLCKPAGAIINLLMPMPQPNPFVDVFRNDPALRAFMIGNAATGTLISLLLLMSSIGSLTLKAWARGGMLSYAVLAIIMTIVGQVVGLLVIGPEIERAMQQSGTPQPPGMSFMSGGTGVAIGMMMGLWYPALILIYFTRPRAKEAFERGLPVRTGI